MKQSKLIKLAECLSKTELNRLGDLVQSPYFNKNATVISLFNIVAEAYPGFDSSDVAREAVFRKLFPGKPFDESRLRYIMTDLVKLIENFLILEEIETAGDKQQHYLTEAFRRRGLDKYCRQGIESTSKSLRHHPYEDMSFFLQQLQNEIDRYNYVSAKRNIAVQENLETLLSSLDTFYIINKLKYSAEVINHTNVWAGDFEPLLLNEILKHINEDNRLKSPAVQIYHSILMTLIEADNESWYKKLKRQLDEHGSRFSSDELNDMYIFARNYCAKQINRGNLSYLNEVFDLYKNLLRDNVLVQDGRISQWDYKNIASVALRLEKYDWAEEFIKKYRSKLSAEHSENAFTYNLALLHYHQGNYGKTLELIRDVEFTDVYYALDCRSLLLKTYYETEAMRPLLSLIDAFYAYLRRNKLISSYQKEGYSNFLKFFKRLMKLRRNDREGAERVKAEIESSEAVANLSWLLKRVEEVE